MLIVSDICIACYNSSYLMTVKPIKTLEYSRIALSNDLVFNSKIYVFKKGVAERGGGGGWGSEVPLIPLRWRKRHNTLCLPLRLAAY